MGVYTSVLHPDDGGELQIKTGNDICRTYNLGDEVHWSVSPLVGGQGTLLDGAYRSYSDRGWDDVVVIKNHRIYAVVPVESPVDLQEIRDEYEVEDPDPSLWSMEAWQLRDQLQIQRDRYAAGISSLPPKAIEVMMDMYSRSQYRRLMTAAVHEMFKPQPLPGGANPIYMKDWREEGE